MANDTITYTNVNKKEAEIHRKEVNKLKRDLQFLFESVQEKRDRFMSDHGISQSELERILNDRGIPLAELDKLLSKKNSNNQSPKFVCECGQEYQLRKINEPVSSKKKTKNQKETGTKKFLKSVSDCLKG